MNNMNHLMSTSVTRHVHTDIHNTIWYEHDTLEAASLADYHGSLSELVLSINIQC